MPSGTASAGWISTNGPSSKRFSRSTLPVFVIVCHWCGRRPVLNVNGWSASGCSAGSTWWRAWNRALPLGVAKRSAPSASR